MDEAIKDLIHQEFRTLGLHLPTPDKAARDTLAGCQVLYDCVNSSPFPKKREKLEVGIGAIIRSLVILAIFYDLSPLENLVKRTNRRITDV